MSEPRFDDTATAIGRDETGFRERLGNEAAKVIFANVVRRMMRNQIDEYQRARSILDAGELSEAAQQIVREEPAVVVALYAVIYDAAGNLRRDEQGQPLARNFIESKILNLKANPHKEQTALLLRQAFLDLRAKMGNGYRKACRELIHTFRKEKPSELKDVRCNEKLIENAVDQSA
jgi:hypothetical protein